jgi:hypothetical protein
MRKMEVGELVSTFEGIVGIENICAAPERVSAYFKPEAEAPGLVAITPIEDSQVQEVVKSASRRGISIYTVRNGCCPDGIASEKGILLDLSKMNQVFKLDSLNLCATIGPGVTFHQMVREVKLCDEKLKLAMPVAADSISVMYNYMGCNVTSLEASLRGRNINICNFYAVLPGEGKVHKSGSHMVSDQDDWPDESPGLMNISNLFFGMDDALGIPVKAVVWIYPIQECRKVIAIGFPDISKAKACLQDSCRKDRFVEAYAANSRFLSVILAKDGADIEATQKGLPPWTVVASVEGSKELVGVTTEVVGEFAAGLGGKEIDNKDYLNLIALSLERPWYVWDRDIYKSASYCIPFHTVFRRILDFDSLFMGSVQEKGCPIDEIGQLIVPMKQGRSVYCEYDLYFESGEEKKYEDLYNYSYEKLVRAGAFVSRPQGKIAEVIYSLNPTMWRLQREIKKKIDSPGILNPDQFIAKEV